MQASGSSAPPPQTSVFAMNLAAYLKGVPSYYHPLLQRALQVRPVGLGRLGCVG